MNVKLLRRVKRIILEEPLRFEMATFAAPAQYWRPKGQRPPCGTVACIAGWAILAEKVDKGVKKIRISDDLLFGAGEKAAALLGIDDQQAHRLFHAINWPEPFHTEYYAADNPTDEAKIAAKRIEHFIKTKGAE